MRFRLLVIFSLLFTSCTVRYTVRIGGVLYNLKEGNFKLAREAVKNSLKKGSLLYNLELGTVEHYAKNYKESNKLFDAAENRAEELYTRSISKQTVSVFTNENVKPYRPEDYEYVFINYFKAFNYYFSGKINDAVVEARKVDNKLKFLNDKQKRTYRDDAFMEFLSGIFHEMAGECNDALVSYRRAYKSYNEEYRKFYGVGMPEFLFKSFKRAAYRTGIELAFLDTVEFSPENGAVIVILEYGFIPQKREGFTDVLWDDERGHRRWIRVAFPYLPDTEITLPPSTSVMLGGQKGTPEIAEPLYRIAKRSLEDKKGRIIAKALLRAAVKYGTQVEVEKKLKKKSEVLSDVVGSIINIFNVATERADTREWGTLPALISVAYFDVSPGKYPLHVSVGNRVILEETVKVGAGEIKLFKVRAF